MTLRIAVQTERGAEGVDEIRERLGNSGNVRGAVTPILRQGARVGTEAARRAAPQGSTGRLIDEIADDAIVFRVRGDVVQARFGVQPVPDPGRGSRLYPIYVHEGTGIYGRLDRRVTPTRASAMVFPGGGKPWPVDPGHTGRVIKQSVSGQRPQPYMRRGYEAAQVYVETHLDEMFNRLVG